MAKMKAFHFFLLTFLVSGIVLCLVLVFSVQKPKLIPALVQPTAEITETLTPLKAFRQAVKEKRYAEALTLVETAAPELVQLDLKSLDDASDDKESEQCFLCVRRFEMYYPLYCLLGEDESALKIYNEIMSALPHQYADEMRYRLFFSYSVILSRLNRVDDFINECNKFVIRPNPSAADYLLGYVYGCVGYIIKKDYSTAELYLAAAEKSFEGTYPVGSENSQAFYAMSIEVFNISKYFLSHLKEEYDMVFNKVPIIISEQDDGTIKTTIQIDVSFISKITGQPISDAELDAIKKKIKNAP